MWPSFCFFKRQLCHTVLTTLSKWHIYQFFARGLPKSLKNYEKGCRYLLVKGLRKAFSHLPDATGLGTFEKELSHKSAKGQFYNAPPLKNFSVIGPRYALFNPTSCSPSLSHITAARYLTGLYFRAIVEMFERHFDLQGMPTKLLSIRRWP
jgi:hypothetical protein